MKEKIKFSIKAMIVLIVWAWVLFYSMGYAQLKIDYMINKYILDEPFALGGYYSGINDYWCLAPETCVHEEGHKIDASRVSWWERQNAANWHSGQTIFQSAVNEINECALKYGAVANNDSWIRSPIEPVYALIHTYSEMFDSSYIELYADLYQHFEYDDVTQAIIDLSNWCLLEIGD